MLYNWNKLNELFFDDIEDDIFDDNIINNNLLNRLYGIQYITDCNTPEDFAEYIDNTLHILTLYVMLSNKAHKLYASVPNKENKTVKWYCPTNLGMQLKLIKLLNPNYNISAKGYKIFYLNDDAPQYEICVYVSEEFEIMMTIWLMESDTSLLYLNNYNIKDYKKYVIDACKSSLGNLKYCRDLYIKDNNINESFFDDIEDDIESDILISQTSFNKLYGLTNIEDCYTKDDFITYLMNILKIEEIVNKINDYLVKYNLYDTKTNNLSIPYRFNLVPDIFTRDIIDEWNNKYYTEWRYSREGFTIKVVDIIHNKYKDVQKTFNVHTLQSFTTVLIQVQIFYNIDIEVNIEKINSCDEYINEFKSKLYDRLTSNIMDTLYELISGNSKYSENGRSF